MQPPDAQDAVFRALADPTRRRMLELLAAADRSVGELHGAFAMSQPAVSQHLRVLREAGLCAERREGRNRIYRLEPETLRSAQLWIADHIDFWTSRMDRLGDYLRKTHGKAEL
jgi:DNA-binding transcriptional ArsR family regulator